MKINENQKVTLTLGQLRKLVKESRESLFGKLDAEKTVGEMKEFLARFGAEDLVSVLASYTGSKDGDRFDFDEAVYASYDDYNGPAYDNRNDDVEAMTREFGLDDRDIIGGYTSVKGTSKYVDFLFGPNEEYKAIEDAFDKYNGYVGVVTVRVEDIASDEDCRAKGITYDDILEYYSAHYDIIGEYESIVDGRRQPNCMDIVIAGGRR